ncbi:MAG: hypothetical protein ACI8W3_003781 [Myxococcota bacterium]|jgi:hypothetical protein
MARRLNLTTDIPNAQPTPRNPLAPSPDRERPTPASSRRSTWLLALGATTGLAAAAWGLAGTATSSQLPEGSIARVNGTVIRTDDFERLVSAVIEDMRSPDPVEARSRVLNRMIEEELLIQRALDLGLVHLDRKVRADLTSSVITSVVNDVKNNEPDDGELEAFFEENKEYFTRPGRMHARQVFFRVAAAGTDPHEAGTAQERAEKASARLAAGDAFEEVREAFGDFEISPIPQAMLPATKLREYIGPTLLRSTSELSVGQWSSPVRSGTGIHLVQLVAQEPSSTPPLAQIQSQVEKDWRRRQGDLALRTYLEELRSAAVIQTAEEFE